MRALGIDLGAKRIGVALSDSAGTVSTPYEVVLRSGERAQDHRRIAELAEEAGALCLVVGWPLRLDGASGPEADAARDEAQELSDATGLPAELWDERLTTVSAERQLKELDLKAPARRKVVDKVAASVMLQAWLDQRAQRLDPPEEPVDE